jgi:dTDP-4-dehydrorhamnose reductase
MRKRKKLLVTGASGFLGWNVARIARSDWNVFGIYNRHHTKIEDVSMTRLDLSDYDNLKKCFNDIRPDAVIHTAAVSNPNYCEMHPMESRKVNVSASLAIADMCSTASIPLLFTSTDLVFDGSSPPYSESDMVNPINVYSEHKVLAEEMMRDVYPETTICRMPLMFGYSGSVNQGFTSKMIVDLKKGDKLHLFSDEYRTPVDAQSASKGLLLFLSKVKGIIHLGGLTRISRYEMGILAADLLSCGTHGIISVKQKDAAMPAKRPADVSLDSSKARSMGYAPMDIKEALKETIGMMEMSRV